MGEKKWNDKTGHWEIDGVQVTYRVTWRSVDEGGAEHTKEFTDIDAGYAFYQGMKNSAEAYDATWEHIPW